MATAAPRPQPLAALSSNGKANASDRIAAGRARRKQVPRSSHAGWQPQRNRPDPVAILEASNLGRVPELVPIRYGRMLVSPFAFLRGSAALMALDLSQTPVTGLKVQTCGDAHVANFGAYATPERNFIFGINDFDETLPAPWEWDVKRLCASLVVAGRAIDLGKKGCTAAAFAAVATYHDRIDAFARATALRVWYARLEVNLLEELVRCAHSTDFRATPRQIVHSHPDVSQLVRLTAVVKGRRRIVDSPPLIFHPRTGAEAIIERTRQSFLQYQETLRDDIRVLFDRYHFVDSAVKVVGVGSVGTHCGIALFLDGHDDPLFLQIKEAMPSVLEPYAGKSRYENHGQRVVAGQRLIQAASDIFLGWIRREDGRDFYFRQLRDMKASAHIDRMRADDLIEYAGFCGWALARAHARAGDAAFISGYIGKKDTFARAIVEFARDYADQTERDYAALIAAVKEGRIQAKSGE
ncbi:MAG: DUF2252 domain-containing protein [Candidatus Eremiobacteraeota bacterium]|nr:DUF2252 domain-containing protein [Candidatus Eremiobacteraeota bacterium]MBV8595282.1 DUF2252 domain-containing protein [Candidatus Eremiobacteraeota bacterium]